MKDKYVIGLILSIMISSCSSDNKVQKEPLNWPDASAPIAEKKAHERIIHGDTVSDPYYWMIDYFKFLIYLCLGSVSN